LAVFAGILDKSGKKITHDNKVAIEAAFQNACLNEPTAEIEHVNRFVLSCYAQDINKVRNDSDALIIVGDPLIRSTSASIENEINDINATSSLEALSKKLAKARGVFSGVKLNKRNGNIYIFTVKSGIRPVYYYQIGDLVIYSSLISLFENLPFVDFKISFNALCEIIAFGFCLSNRTVYQNIKRLNGGECLSIIDRTVNTSLYWVCCDIPVKLDISEDDVEAAFTSFDDAIILRLQQTKEGIAFLSGGLDSRVTCSQVNEYVNKLHTFNFSTDRSQDNGFAKLFAENTGLIHHEKQFDTLAYPNWAQLISDEINCAQLNNDTNQKVVRYGGSVAVGNVYIDEEVNQHFNIGDNVSAINSYLTTTKISLSTRFLKHKYKKQSVGLLEGTINKELLCNSGEPAKSMYYFLMNNDQKRHLQLHFETICQHKTELNLPFFDSDFLKEIYAIPSSDLLNHKLYMRWFQYFPNNTQTVPWQTYPNHEKCPLKVSTNLSYQWGSVRKKEKTNVSDYAIYLKAKNTHLFKRFFDSKKTFVAMLLHRFGIKNFSYLVNNFNKINC